MIAEKLVLLNVAVRKNRANLLLAKLLHSGFYHPFDASSIIDKKEYVHLTQQIVEPVRWRDIEKRFNAIVSETQISFLSSSTPVSYVEAETTLSGIEETLQPLFEQKNKIQQEITEIQNYLERRPFYLPVPAGNYTFIHIEKGQIKEESLEVLENLLENIPHIVIPSDWKKGLLIVGIVILKKDVKEFERIKKEIGWVALPSDILISDIPIEHYTERIKRLKEELEKINEKIKKVIEENKDNLEKIATSVEIYQKLSAARRHTAATQTVMIISGWIPENRIKSATDIVKETDPAAFFECIPAEKTGLPIEKIPVSFRHNKFLKPFELIVETYGLPAYGTIDPTIFVAISFLLMFGAMFGDIGHGLVFIVAGLLMLLKAKGSFRRSGYLVTYAGISSSVFGLLYGSFFGIEFHPVWISPMENISEMFRTCILFGVIILTAGIVLNIINQIIRKDRVSLLFDKAGLFSGLIFWTGAGIVTLYLSKAENSVIKILAFIFCASIVAIFLRSVFEAIRHKEGVLVGFIEGFLHIFEIMMGYIANTVSFIRISAFALNHIGFFMTIFAISQMLQKAKMDWLSWIVIVFGNIFVIILEGLVVMIQSLRLNYYEFFSRFFVSGSTAYKPIELKVFTNKIEEYLT